MITVADERRVEPVVAEPSGQPTLHALTGLRFAAALLVAFSHFPEMIPIDGLAAGLEREGAAGVTIFFVLSGFVLTYRYGETFRLSTTGTGTFIRARAARIVPMCVVALLVTTVTIALVTEPDPLRTVRSWIINLFMLQSLMPTHEMNNWNVPAWSVSAELVFYCVFPFFVYLVLRRVPHHRMRTLAAVLLTIEVALFCAAVLVVERAMAGRDAEDIHLVVSRMKFFPGLRIWEFFLGCVLGTAYVAARSRRRAGGPPGRLDQTRVRNGMLLVAGIALVVIVLLPTVVDTPESGLIAQLMWPGLYLAYTPIAMLLVAAIAWGPTVLSPAFEHRWARVLGDSSYSFYLLQGSLLYIVAATWAPSPTTWWFSTLGVLVLIVLSILSARWIEQPARRLLRGRTAQASAPALARTRPDPSVSGARGD